MLQLALGQALAEQVAHLAAQRQRSAEEMGQEAVRRYLLAARQAQIARERAALDPQLSVRLDPCPGEDVAIYNGRVLDHDPALRPLHRRLVAQ